MKPLSILLFTLGICCIRPTAAQEPVSLAFSNQLDKESETVRLMAELQQIKAWEVLVTGKIAGLSYTLQTVHCINGKEQRSTPIDPQHVTSDTLRLLFFTQPIGQDSVRILIHTPQYKTAFGHTVQGAGDCILLEPFPEKDQTTTDIIPVMAFSSGAPTKFNIGGETVSGISFCRVRDSHLHPSKWHEQFKLKDYLYFEIKFTKPQRPENK